jgi:hypothetical protein
MENDTDERIIGPANESITIWKRFGPATGAIVAATSATTTTSTGTYICVFAAILLR